MGRLPLSVWPARVRTRTGVWTRALTGAGAVLLLEVAGGGPSSAEILMRDRGIAVLADTSEANAVRLGRAALEQSLGNPRGVVECLEPADFSSPSEAWEIDRAAFLLAQAYLALGSLDRFERLAERVTSWSLRTPYTRWLAHQLAALRSGGAILAPEGETVLHSLLDGVPGPDAELLARYAAAARLPEGDRDADGALSRIAEGDTTTPLGRALVGAALLRRATRLAGGGEDPRSLLAAVPPEGRYASRARHMLGVALLERGEVEAGAAVLRSLLAQDSSYAGRRAAWLAVAAPALEAGRWEEAFEIYRRCEEEWLRDREELEGWLASGRSDDLRRNWGSGLWLDDAIALDAAPVRRAAERLAEESADLTRHPGASLPSLAGAPPAGRSARLVPAPPPETKDELAASSRGLAEIRHELERARWGLAHEEERLADERRFLAYGRRLAGDESRRVATRAATGDSVRRALESILGRLQGDHDETRRHVTWRTTAILRQTANQKLWLSAMRHYYLAGPQRERFLEVPPSVPTAEEIVAQEEALAEAIRALADRLSAEVPDLLARIHSEARRGALRDRALAQELEVRRLRGATTALAARLDSTLATRASSAQRQRLAARVASLEGSADSSAAAHAALERELAERALRQAVARLETEREAIDYGLAAAAYGRSVSLLHADSVATATGATATAGSSSATESPESATWRRRAIGHHEGFLQRHPASFARGEMRFRLADLLLVAARQEFREKMALFVSAPAEGPSRVPLPSLDPSRALSLYDSILEEDRDFPHRDAVLRNAGTVLADDADPRSVRYFQELVVNHPESPFCQEAYLRMGDLQFLERRFEACLPLFASAAAGSDTGLRLIALYKRGWAEFNLDRFLAAADAFREILDVYEAGRHGRFAVDVESEAEAYVIHSLARAGGAVAFAQYFDRIGRRPYEQRLLLAMGQHFRRYSLYAEAAATDQLHVERVPLHADALVSAERMTDTYRRWDRPALALEAQRRYAPHFAPESEWSRAQTSDSVRAAGAAFAKSCYAAVASHHHQEAVRRGSPADWRAALDLYRSLLAHWPDDTQASAVALLAGEACAALEDFEGALVHYAKAAESGSDTIPETALRQRVAVTDRRYEQSRPSSGTPAHGSDTLARAVLAAGDELLRRYPEHSGGADIVWRQGNLAFAHGWHERAADDLARMSDQYPADERTPLGATLRGDALFRLGRYEEAGAAFETAIAAARDAGRDSVARRAAEAIPVCYFRHAEAAVTADSTDHMRHAALFERVATEWPEYEHAPLAQYRAGLAYLRAGHTEDGVRAMQALVQRFPDGEFAKDAQLQIAQAWESSAAPEKAAPAYAEFADRFAADPSADEAVLRAADLFAAVGLEARSDEMRLSYLERYPDDAETGMEILEQFARRELLGLGPERPISSLLRGGDAPRSRLAEYVAHTATRPDLASPGLVAQVRFLEGEEARAACAGIRLRQPLRESVAAKQKHLDGAIALYRQSVDLGISEWAHASAFRIGEMLESFGKELEESERPADLSGDDLVAYEEVLRQEARGFYDRAEGVWTDLLTQQAGEPGEERLDNEWLARARTSLYGRLAARFLYRAEVEFPLVASPRPEAPRAAQVRPAGGADGAGAERELPAYARGDGKE